MSRRGNDIRFNDSGCKDPTAYEAITHVAKEEKELSTRVRSVVNVIKDIISLSGFELIGRIQIKDKKTGKEFR